jgi:hypothetical protein
MTRRIVSPPQADHDELVPPLNAAELEAFKFLDDSLSADWEIYVRPFLNGLRPTFVLLNPAVGVAVVDVRDWNFQTGSYLRILSGRLISITAEDGKHTKTQNPLHQVQRYKTEIQNLYCPTLGANGGIAAISALVIFPLAIGGEAAALLGEPAWPQYCAVSDGDDLKRQDLGAVFPEAARTTSAFMSPEVAEDFRAWLGEPRRPVEQRRAIKLDSQQTRLIRSRAPGGLLRMRGPAGCGKTVVLAGRANALTREGKDVLFITFNITLGSYVGDMMEQLGGNRNSVTRLHFHDWAKRVLIDCDMRSAWAAAWHEEQPDAQDAALARALNNALTQPDHEFLTTQYDAILVDEGQDLTPSWWGALRRVLKPGGEMVLAADFGQDLYGRSGSWTETAMADSGFKHPWVELPVCYRLPSTLLELLRGFRSEFPSASAPTVGESPPQLQFRTCELSWRQTTPDFATRDALKAIDELLKSAGALETGASDICVLADNNQTGQAIVAELTKRYGKVVHTFAADKRGTRALKLRFRQGSGRITVTTIHSFKGWEAPLMVVVLTNPSPENAYVALSRLGGKIDGRSLQVVCAAPRLARWGSTWPRFIDFASELSSWNRLETATSSATDRPSASDTGEDQHGQSLIAPAFRNPLPKTL